MVRVFPAFITMVVMLIESDATIKPLSQAIGSHVVEKLELGGWMWNLEEEEMMDSTLSISKFGDHHSLWWIRWVETTVWWETTDFLLFL